MTIASELTTLNSTKQAIKAALTGKGANLTGVNFAGYADAITALPTGGGAPDVPTSWTQTYYDKVQTYASKRSTEWVQVPAFSGIEEKIYIVVNVDPNTGGSCTFRAVVSGTVGYTVDWGDGNTSSIPYSSTGTYTTYHTFNYSSLPSSSKVVTLSSGIKQVLVTVTPNTGDTFTSLVIGSNIYNSQSTDTTTEISISSAAATTISIAPISNLKRLIINLGTQNISNSYIYNCSELEYIEFPNGIQNTSTNSIYIQNPVKLKLIHSPVIINKYILIYGTTFGKYSLITANTYVVDALLIDNTDTDNIDIAYKELSVIPPVLPTTKYINTALKTINLNTTNTSVPTSSLFNNAYLTEIKNSANQTINSITVSSFDAGNLHHCSIPTVNITVTTAPSTGYISHYINANPGLAQVNYTFNYNVSTNLSSNNAFSCVNNPNLTTLNNIPIFSSNTYQSNPSLSSDFKFNLTTQGVRGTTTTQPNFYFRNSSSDFSNFNGTYTTGSKVVTGTFPTQIFKPGMYLYHGSMFNSLVSCSYNSTTKVFSGTFSNGELFSIQGMSAGGGDGSPIFTATNSSTYTQVCTNTSTGSQFALVVTGSASPYTTTIYKSDDNWNTKTIVNTYTTSSFSITRLIYLPATNKIYAITGASTADHMYAYSSNNGTSWTNTANGNTFLANFNKFTVNSSYIFSVYYYASYNSGGIFGTIIRWDGIDANAPVTIKNGLLQSNTNFALYGGTTFTHHSTEDGVLIAYYANYANYYISSSNFVVDSAGVITSNVSIPTTPPFVMKIGTDYYAILSGTLVKNNLTVSSTFGNFVGKISNTQMLGLNGSTYKVYDTTTGTTQDLMGLPTGKSEPGLFMKTDSNSTSYVVKPSTLAMLGTAGTTAVLVSDGTNITKYTKPDIQVSAQTKPLFVINSTGSTFQLGDDKTSTTQSTLIDTLVPSGYSSVATTVYTYPYITSVDSNTQITISSNSTYTGTVSTLFSEWPVNWGTKIRNFYYSGMGN